MSRSFSVLTDLENRALLLLAMSAKHWMIKIVGANTVPGNTREIALRYLGRTHDCLR